MILRPAHSGDLRRFYAQGIPMTARAWVAEKNGTVVGVGGYYFHLGKAVAFTDNRGMTKREIVVAAHFLMTKLRRLRMDVVAATAGDGVPLKHFGFESVGDAWILR